eukprot:scaffold25817_cov33-Tisochrysis_lutea.AAC.4
MTADNRYGNSRHARGRVDEYEAEVAVTCLDELAHVAELLVKQAGAKGRYDERLVAVRRVPSARLLYKNVHRTLAT